MVSITEQSPDQPDPSSTKKVSPSFFRQLLGKLNAAIAVRISSYLPKGLYARALLIIILPIVILESVVTFVFMERHWETVTQRLSQATSRDVAMLIAVYESLPKRPEYRKEIVKLAKDKLDLSVQILPAGELPPPRPKPYFDLLDKTLSKELSARVKKPFWINTLGRARFVEIRVKLESSVFRVVARRSQTYASNSHIFLLWMLGTSLILLTVAILFLRNQIKPILKLADVVEGFGMGQTVPKNFKPRGAREVRAAAGAFIKMSDRIERHVEQRTAMLAGVSHDLRTILTRFKFQLAMFDDRPEVEAMSSDVNEMQHMLEDYLAFAKGDSGEDTVETDIVELIDEICTDFELIEKKVEFECPEEVLYVHLRRHAFKRAVTNLISNAIRFGTKTVVRLLLEEGRLKIEIHDNGPGISVEQREEVFRPFYRLDTPLNTNQGHSGLGLAIARDIVRNHGGDISLSESELGGLRALISIPF